MSTVPDRLSALLDGPSSWHRLVHHETVGSTNDEAARLVADGHPAGIVVVADRQTAGRGRLGRPWEDRPDGCLLVSTTVAVPATSLTLVPLAAGVALADALLRQDITPELKWPNDVLVGGRKLAGILVERHGDQLVIGVGVDIDWRGVEREGDAVAWTSVAEERGADADRWDVLVDLLRGLDVWLRSLADSPLRLLDTYGRRCSTIGRHVQVETPAGELVEGVATGLARDGALTVDVGGSAVAVSAGDVTHVR